MRIEPTHSVMRGKPTAEAHGARRIPCWHRAKFRGAAAPLFTLNEWHDVVIEQKKSALLLKIDGQKHVVQSAQIDGNGQHQFDFKAVDFGSCEIDDFKLREGL